MSIHRFRLQSDDTYQKVVQINDTFYKFIVPKVVWDKYNVSSHVKYWISQKRKGRDIKFKYGDVIPNISNIEEVTFKCQHCAKEYKTRKGFNQHVNKCHHTEIEPYDIQPQVQNITTSHSNNVTNNIQINVPLRNFSDENPEWLTKDVFMNAILNIPSAIPHLIKEKHFNDNFPENRNVRLDNKRDIRKRLQVYDAGRWKLEDRPEIEYKIIAQMYDTLNEVIAFVIDDDNESMLCEDSSAFEKRIEYIARKIRASQNRNTRVRKIVNEWKSFVKQLQIDYEKTIEPLSDRLDTLLLDNDLRIKQLEEERTELISNGAETVSTCDHGVSGGSSLTA